MDRENSPAYAALSPAGRRCLRVIEAEIARCGGEASISRAAFERSGISRIAAARGLKQIVHLGFVEVGQGSRRISIFRLSGRWQAIDGADEAATLVRLAKLPKPQPVTRAAPRKPVANRR